MSSYIVLFNSAMITAFIYLSNICYANGVDFGSLERVPESYQENGEDASLKKDVFLNSQLFAETLTFIDPVSFLTASLVCRDWRGICKNAQLMEWYTSKSFQEIYAQLNSPEPLSEKFARLFVEIEVAKIIEHHRPKFPYTENVQIKTSALINLSSLLNTGI